MSKLSSKFFVATSLTAVLFTGCGQYEKAQKILPNEIVQADQCKNTNKEFEVDCYDLISYKNSIALLRVAIVDYGKGNYKDALMKLEIVKQNGNFYANALLADMYFKGRGVKQNQEKGLELLKDVDSVDPIAAYKLAFYYLNKKDHREAIELLTFAADNSVKEAQKELSKIYREGKITKTNMEKSKKYYEAYEKNQNSFINKIYGI